MRLETLSCAITTEPLICIFAASISSADAPSPTRRASSSRSNRSASRPLSGETPRWIANSPPSAAGQAG
jgi:hypothetical protein